ncbi:MAG: RNA-binding S4 domain-containing protein [Bacteroidia bacterium]|nr:RNA-binding S4 domain-containing protein [Bacteroidia bacterium]
MRIDKYLWCVRLFKTRTMATDACNGGKVKLHGDNVKPARELKVGDTLEMKKGPITRRYRVLAFPNSRVSPKLAEQFVEDITPETEILKLESLKFVSVVRRDPGAGRPTKKDRREMEDFMVDEDDE